MIVFHLTTTDFEPNRIDSEHKSPLTHQVIRPIAIQAKLRDEKDSAPKSRKTDTVLALAADILYTDPRTPEQHSGQRRSKNRGAVCATIRRQRRQLALTNSRVCADTQDRRIERSPERWTAPRASNLGHV